MERERKGHHEDSEDGTPAAAPHHVLSGKKNLQRIKTLFLISAMGVKHFDLHFKREVPILV